MRLPASDYIYVLRKIHVSAKKKHLEQPYFMF